MGNFSGVTVDRKSATIELADGHKATLTDLPGSHSLSPNSLDEQVVFDVLINQVDSDHPDLVIVVLNSSVLSKGLFLTTQVIDLDIPVLVALNMEDLALEKGIVVDHSKLANELGCPVVQINAREKKGLDDLKKAMSQEIGQSTKTFFAPSGSNHIVKYNQWLRQSSSEAAPQLNAQDRMHDISHRYEAIDGIISRVEQKAETKKETRTKRLDKILLNRVWGPLVFLAVFFLVFQAVFSAAEYPMNWIDAGMATLSDAVVSLMPEGMLQSFVVDGILAGIHGVVIFLPQIMILFGLIAILEESGYMARASFLNDKLLGFTGMNGKSIVPLVGGFACAIPAVMAARSIGNAKARLITILVTPLMSCSARLPVYIFLIAFVVPDEFFLGVINLQGLFMLGLYMLGILAAVAIAFVLNKSMKSDKPDHFILELPEYQSPRWKDVALLMVNKGKTFVFEAGKIILIISVILWGLESFAPSGAFEAVEAKYSETPAGWTQDDVDYAIASEKLEASYAGIIGHQIEPILRPLGFDWKIGIAVVTSFAAREVFVGTMSTIYGLHGDEENISELRDELMTRIDPVTGQPIMTLPVAFSLIIFYVFAMQCMSTVAIVRKETGGWKWPILQFVAMTALAYFASFLMFQLLS